MVFDKYLRYILPRKLTLTFLGCYFFFNNSKIRNDTLIFMCMGLWDSRSPMGSLLISETIIGQWMNG